MGSAVSEFAEEVEPIRLKVGEVESTGLKEVLFEGRSPDPLAFRVFGGWLVAQALAAAGRTVPAGRWPLSLHASFLRPADSAAPLVHAVTRTLDGRSLSNRRVEVRQGGRLVVHVVASFREPAGGTWAATGPGYGHGPAAPRVPPAATLPSLDERLAALGPAVRPPMVRRSPLDMRFAAPPTWADTSRSAREPRNAVWVRTDGDLPDDPLLHACAVAYATDLTILDTLVLPHAARLAGRWIPRSSLDHVLRFHRPFRADRWWLYDQEGTVLHDGLGTVHGRLFGPGGELFASVSQEALFSDPAHDR